MKSILLFNSYYMGRIEDGNLFNLAANPTTDEEVELAQALTGHDIPAPQPEHEPFDPNDFDSEIVDTDMGEEVGEEL